MTYGYGKRGRIWRANRGRSTIGWGRQMAAAGAADLTISSGDLPMRLPIPAFLVRNLPPVFEGCEAFGRAYRKLADSGSSSDAPGEGRRRGPAEPS